MTFSEEYIPDRGQDLGEDIEYPTAFGITFTPRVQMYSLIGLGVVGFLYILMNLTWPAWKTLETKQAEQRELESQIEMRSSEEYAQKISRRQQELREKEALRQQVLALFADEESLKTLLLDVNRFFKSRNVELLSFTPSDPTIINDGSLGTAVNNKLKRQTVSLDMQGDFRQIYSIVRDLERLQPLVVVNSLNANVLEGGDQVFVVASQGGTEVIPGGDTKVKVSAQVSVLLPLTAAEKSRLESAAAEKKPAEKK